MKYTLLAVRGLVLAAALVVDVAEADLVAHCSFDEVAEKTASGAIRPKQWLLAGRPDTVDGRVGAALRFDGADDCLSLADSSVGDLNRVITIAAWIKVHRFDKDFQTVVAKGNMWRIARDGRGDTLQFAANSGPATWAIRGNVNVNDDRWHHVVAVYDGMIASLYTDGQLDGSLVARTGIANSDAEVTIGANAVNVGRWWNGLIDDVLIFDHALTETEVGHLYGTGGEKFTSDTLGVLAGAVTSAEMLLASGDRRGAATFIERKIAAYERWRAQPSQHTSTCPGILLSDLYFLLAEARGTSNRRPAEVTELYRKSALLPVGSRYWVPAVLHLHRDTTPEDVAGIIQTSLRNTEEPTVHLQRAAVAFERANDWAAFELFFRTVLAGQPDVTPFARSILQGLTAGGTWASRFLNCCRDCLALRSCYGELRHEQAAAEMQRTHYDKAIHIYRDILRHCEGEPDESRYELALCECMFRNGQYPEVIAEVERFLDRHAGTSQALARRARVLKGRSHMKLNQTDQAMHTFGEVIKAWDGTPEATEVRLYAAYGRMAEGQWDEARRMLIGVLQDSARTSSTIRARLCLQKLENIRR